MKSYPEIKTEYLARLYKKGNSLPEISEKVGMTNQAIRTRLLKAGFKTRSFSEAVKLAIKRGRLKVETGENHHSWKGGRYKTKDGYIEIHIGNNRRKPEHRIVWEKTYGEIPKGHIIHHLNGIRDDNRIENLSILPRKRHSPMEIIKPHQKRIRELEKQLAKVGNKLY